MACTWWCQLGRKAAGVSASTEPGTGRHPDWPVQWPLTQTRPDGNGFTVAGEGGADAFKRAGPWSWWRGWALMPRGAGLTDPRLHLEVAASSYGADALFRDGSGEVRPPRLAAVSDI
jgi:hypothetical protein